MGGFILIYVISLGYKLHQINETEKRLRDSGGDPVAIESHLHKLRKEAEPGGCISVIVGLVALIAVYEFIL